MLGPRAKEVTRFVASIAIAQAAGGLGSLATTPAIPTWYPTLAKPAFTPPSWLFAPVWTTLFVLMGIALYLVWRQYAQNQRTRPALALFFMQLALNVSWSFGFFSFKSPLAGLVIIVALWIAIAETIRSFARVSQVAAYLLIPYLVWVSFATILNASIVFLNM